MPYADFTFYQETYQGTMNEADFNRLAPRASAYLDAITYGKLDAAWQTEERVKCACCAIAEEYAVTEQGGEITSTNNDGYAESYAVSGRTAEQRYYQVAALYLGGTGLLYRGIRHAHV